MNTPSILPSSDAASIIVTDVSNFDHFFEITFDASNANNLSVDNVYYGFSQNNNVFDNIDFQNQMFSLENRRRSCKFSLINL